MNYKNITTTPKSHPPPFFYIILHVHIDPIAVLKFPRDFQRNFNYLYNDVVSLTGNKIKWDFTEIGVFISGLSK